MNEETSKWPVLKLTKCFSLRGLYNLALNPTSHSSDAHCKQSLWIFIGWSDFPSRLRNLSENRTEHVRVELIASLYPLMHYLSAWWHSPNPYCSNPPLPPPIFLCLRGVEEHSANALSPVLWQGNCSIVRGAKIGVDVAVWAWLPRESPSAKVMTTSKVQVCEALVVRR